MPLALQVDALSHRFGAHRILSNFYLQQQRGDHKVLLGPSGSGKSTLINLVTGLLTPDSGTILVDGEPMTGVSPDRRDDLRRRKIGLVFQSHRLIAALDVRANLALAERLTGSAGESRIAELLDQLGIGSRAHARPRELSQGEAQRIAIARALVGNPALVIADEPTSALDDDHADAVARLLLDACERFGSTLLIATHDARLKRILPEAIRLEPIREPA